MIVDKEFLSLEEVTHLKNVMCEDPKWNFPWIFHKSTNIKTDNCAILDGDNIVDSPQFVHMAMFNKQKQSPFADNCISILNQFAKKNNIRVDDIIRIKANMILKNCDAGIHYPHVDADKDHLVFLYYVNDSDGDTIFFNEKYDGSKIDNLTVMSRVSPESGKAVVFDGRTYHASSSPSIGDYRCVINIDFIGSL